MTDNNTGYKCLSVATLEANSTYAPAYSHIKNLVNMNSSALEVMTDLHFVPASTIASSGTLEQANQQMISQGVRLLLVVDAEDHVIGLITARDIDDNHLNGDRTLAAAMTPYSEIEVIMMGDILHAVVGDLVETLKRSKRQHALVADKDPFSDQTVIRGVFSATQIARQLGIALKSSEILQTFEEIDKTVQSTAISH